MMTSNMSYENIAVIIGYLVNLRKVHERLGAAFYEITVRVNRTTEGKHDDIVVYAPQWALPAKIAISDTIRLTGEVRVYKNRNSLWQAKCMKVYTKKIDIMAPNAPHTNRVELIGDVCKVWNRRTTPISGRVLTDFSVAVHRTGGYSKGDRSDHIHCIAWSNAEYEKIKDSVGKKAKIVGRIQERTFEKQRENGTVTKETIHEISCSSIEIL